MATSPISLEIIKPMARPIDNVLTSIGQYLPTLIAAAVIIVLGYIVAWAMGLLLRKLLDWLHVDRYCIEKTSIRKILGGFELSKTLGIILKWWIFSLFLASASELLKLEALKKFLETIASHWIPAVISGFLLALVGLLVADYVAKLIRDTRAKYSRILADIARWTIIVLVFMTVLDTVGLETRFVATTMQTLLQGIVFAMALALALAFGLGGKDEAKKIISKATKPRK